MKRPLRYFQGNYIPKVGTPFVIISKTTLIPKKSVRAEVLVIIERSTDNKLDFHARAMTSHVPEDIASDRALHSAILSEKQLHDQAIQFAQQVVRQAQDAAYQNSKDALSLCSVELNELKTPRFVYRFWLDQRGAVDFPRFAKHSKCNDLRTLLTSVMQLTPMQVDDNPYPDFYE